MSDSLQYVSSAVDFLQQNISILTYTYKMDM